MSVEDKDGTNLYGTKVDILQGDTVLFSATADKVSSLRSGEHAIAGFELEKGTYFIRLRRASYSDDVYLLDFTKSVQLDLVMLLNKPTYAIYGRIVDEPAGKWDGQDLYVVDGKGALAARSRIRGGGYYSVALLDPEKDYTLRLGEGAERKESAPFKYSSPGIYYLKIDLRGLDSALANASPSITVSPGAEAGGIISAYLREGTKGVSSQMVNVTTPKGRMIVSSDENGVVRVGAADYGKYVFEWKGQKAAVTVQKPREAEVRDSPRDANPSDIIEAPKNRTGGVRAGGGSFLIGAGVAAAVAALLLGVGAVAVIAYFLGMKKKPKRKGRK